MRSSARTKKATGRKTGKPKHQSGLAPAGQRLIERAMAVTGLSLADLAYEGARQILAAKDRMVLAGADRDAFLKAIARPRVPTRKLVAALKRRRDIAR
jgi:uncharacterized protein (DUF1778 family)